MPNRVIPEDGLPDAQFEKTIAELKEFVRIPSVTSDKQACIQAAQWLRDKLDQMGMEPIHTFETEGNPILFCEWRCGDDSAPTVLVYGHYDVQTAKPLGEWETDPFEPEIRGVYLHGRGTSDMKGQILAVLTSIEIMLESGTVPVNFKFLFEGNEEAPPQVLEEFLPAHRTLFRADISLNCDAGMLGPDMPTISYGLRGGSVNIIRVHGPVRDLHDGGYGGAIENPIHVLCSLIAGLHDDACRITLPDFYDRVRVLSEDERSLLSSLPIDDDFILEQAGVPELWGDAEFTVLERLGARPSLNVRLFNAGELKGAIPQSAEARLAIRLVPDQDPAEVHRQLKRYVAANLPGTVTAEVEYIVGYSPYLVDRDLPAMRSLSDALESAWGKSPLYHLVGGGIPVVELLQRSSGVESLLTGFSLPGDHIHGPNERLHLPTVRKGIPALVDFFYRFGESANGQA